ncbi:MAG: hypothetical protein IJA65_00085 [Acholeplasmatales bacterium]|nr:hypothetical protein [Acholeplasmatales bacterium]
MNVKYAKDNQNMIFNILKQAKKQDRLSHAYLFYGEEGTGKKEMAYALACMIYCDNDGCLECDTCKNILEGNHMNVDYIGIEANKTMISKDQITNLQDEFSKTSLVDGTRIYIVDGIDTASMAAQNSLLKFIEEPVNQTPTVGIFLARDLSNVVTTIQSRCVLEHFKTIPIEKNINELVDSGKSLLDSILAANLTNNLEEACDLIESIDFNKTRDLFLELLNINKPKTSVMYYLNNQSFFSNQKNLSMLLEWIILFLEDCNLYQEGNDNLILKPLCDKIKEYKRKNERELKNKLKMTLDLFNKLKYNVSAKNIFHELISNLI